MQAAGASGCKKKKPRSRPGKPFFSFLAQLAIRFKCIFLARSRDLYSDLLSGIPSRGACSNQKAYILNAS